MSFRPQSLSPLQEHSQSMVSMTTNPGRPLPQHSGTMQAQLHQPAHPGFQPAHQQQQIQYHNQQIFSQQLPPHQVMGPVYDPQSQALQELNDHVAAYVQQFGGLPQQPPMVNMQQRPVSAPMMAPQQRPVTPVNGFAPATPMTARSGRAEHALLDVSPMPMPMPMPMGNIPVVQVQEPMSHGRAHSGLFSDSFAGSDLGYASYQSSLVDPTSPIRSPVRHGSIQGMPTVYEDISPVSSQGAFPTQEHMLLAAAAGSGDLRYYSQSPMSPMRPPMSPREAMLANLDIDATIEDTGISAEEVQQYISEQDPVDSRWTCLFPECDKKFGRKENIKSHVQTHLGDRQFRCNHCGKCFVRQHDLKRHAKIHSGDKPHKCPCGNGFARQDALTRHRQRGVCEGALPGFERKEVKRGRPRKSRPDMSDRLDKASRSRQADAHRSSSTYYGSSSPSDRSYPDTPPQDINLSDDFNNFTTDGTNTFNSFINSYEDTPPTSPVTMGTSSPAKTAEKFDTPATNSFEFVKHAERNKPESLPSSPPGLDKTPNLGAQCTGDAFASTVFDFGAVSAEPNPYDGTEVFTPEGSSSGASEHDRFSPATIGNGSCFQNSFDTIDWVKEGLYTPNEAQLADMMNHWMEDDQ